MALLGETTDTDHGYNNLMSDLVSVVIPNRNGGIFIRDCLESVFAQTYTNLEILVIDDGSTDNSLEELAMFAGKIRLISGRNLGAASARNIGMRASHGRYIALLDIDDIWEANKIQRQIDFLNQSKLDLVYCDGQEFGPNNAIKLIHKARYSGDVYEYFKKFPARAIIELGCSSALFRTSILELSGEFDESFSGAAEDWDFFRRYSIYAKVGFVPEILVYYRRHENSITAGSINSYYEGNRQAILKMFREDPNILFRDRRFIWSKFHYQSTKSYLKCGNITASIRCLVRVVLPIPLKSRRGS